jgi:hypothetical protein
MQNTGPMPPRDPRVRFLTITKLGKAPGEVIKMPPTEPVERGASVVDLAERRSRRTTIIEMGQLARKKEQRPRRAKLTIVTPPEE